MCIIDSSYFSMTYTMLLVQQSYPTDGK